MDFFSFVIGVATQVLGQTIADLISGKRQAARRVEIELEVRRILLEQRIDETRELKRLIANVMAEVDLLSRRDPDLIVTPKQIGLRNVRRLENEAQIDRELHDKLFRLGKIIEQRRDELGLPSSHIDESITVAGKSVDVIDVEWEEVKPRRLPSHWEQQFKEMDERIRRMRSQD